MFTITDYYNLIDFKGNIFDAIHDYDLPFSETISVLYKNFISHVSDRDKQTAHEIVSDMEKASEDDKREILGLLDMWAYDSISHGI